VATSDHSGALSDFVSGLRFQDLPGPVIERLKLSILDTLGCGVYGSTTQWGRIVSDYARRVDGRCILWGCGGQSDAANAALANGTMVHSFELDDVHYGGRLHPGGVTVTVALALAAENGAVSGRDLLTALAVGYESVIRVGICQGISAFNRGWHPTGTAGTFGAAATAARLLGLSPKATRNCLGIAGTMPAGLMAAQFGAMVKRLFVGHAAMAGVMAGRLAAEGFTGIPDILDADFGGYPKALSDKTRMEELSRDLGSRYEILGLSYKLYSCVGTNQTALDAVKEILRAHPVAPEDVSSVVVRTSEYQKLHSGWDYQPSTIMGAQMNMGYCIAALITDGEVFVGQFTDEKIRNPDLVALAARVRVDVDPLINALPPEDRTSEVELTTRSGERFRARKEFAKGHARNLPTWGDMEAKFESLAGKVLPKSHLDDISRLITTIEDASNVSALTGLLAL
jgi:aconitate decarboxylase